MGNIKILREFRFSLMEGWLDTGKGCIPWWLKLGEVVSGTEGGQQKEVKSKCVCLRLSKVCMRWFKGGGICSGISCTPWLNLTVGSQDHTRNSCTLIKIQVTVWY